MNGVRGNRFLYRAQESPELPVAHASFQRTCHEVTCDHNILTGGADFSRGLPIPSLMQRVLDSLPDLSGHEPCLRQAKVSRHPALFEFRYRIRHEIVRQLAVFAREMSRIQVAAVVSNRTGQFCEVDFRLPHVEKLGNRGAKRRGWDGIRFLGHQRETYVANTRRFKKERYGLLISKRPQSFPEERGPVSPTSDRSSVREENPLR